MTVKEAAEYLRVHPDTIYTMVRRKEIPHYRVRSKIFFSEETIEAWKRNQEANVVEAM